MRPAIDVLLADLTAALEAAVAARRDQARALEIGHLVTAGVRAEELVHALEMAPVYRGALEAARLLDRSTSITCAPHCALLLLDRVVEAVERARTKQRDAA